MNEIKYTTDGKKVVVLGNLNAQEKIVQEIFVTSDGAEIPAGENFVVKSLLDAPAESRQAKEAKRIEERLKAGKERLDKAETELRKRESLVLEPLREKIKLIEQTAKELHPGALKLLSDFLFGRLKYSVSCGYHPTINEFKPETQINTDSYYGNTKFEGLKLISLMGRNNGDLLWRIHSYGDGSGSSQEVYLVATLHEAKQKLVEAMASRDYSQEELAELAKWDISPDPIKLSEYRESKIKYCESIVSDYEKKLSDARAARDKAMCEEV
jgi:hypothetical protein